MKSVQIRITGQSPLLQSCDRLADPLDPATIAHKKLTSIRGKSKTDDVIRDIAKSQYINSLYWSDDLGVVMPTVNIKKCLESGAKLTRNGDKVRKGVMLFDESVKLEYGKNLTREQLWEAGSEFLDKRSVVVSQSKVMCYRPKFTTWSCQVEVHYDPDIIEEGWILDYLNAAGAYIGIGGFRPEKNGMFGRFTAEIIK
jgi:hypothetical protein